jgi:uncharacterized protein YbaP (TraB family)
MLAIALVIAWSVPRVDAATACVWKVTGSNGAVLYLGGSMHALRPSDYPLPAAYNRAFDASSQLVFEEDPKQSRGAEKMFEKLATYPRGDSLKKHVDPRTYDYLRRVFKLIGVPEEKFSRLRPWALALSLQSPRAHGLSGDLGVEGFLEKRARANAKPISGLESFREHLEVFSGLSERQSEALLLLLFIPNEPGQGGFDQAVRSWRQGDVETLTRRVHEGFVEFPAMAERMLGRRNRAWMPKIEGYLRSGQTYFVVAGAGHMGGRDGLLALLKARGYRIEQM